MDVAIEIGKLKDGGVVMVTEKGLPDIVKRIEYYRDQRLMQLVYHDEGMDDYLMHHELSEEMVYSVENSPDIIIYSLFEDHAPIGYKVPLIKVGELY